MLKCFLFFLVVSNGNSNIITLETDTTFLASRNLRHRLLQNAKIPPPETSDSNAGGGEFERPDQKTTKNGQKISDYKFPKTAQHILESGIGVIIVCAAVGSLLVSAAVCS